MNASKSNLFPILPSTIRDSRDRGIVCVRVSPAIVPLRANLVSAPSSRYAMGRKAQAGVIIVTEARIAEPGVSDRLNAWLAVISGMITEERVHLLESSHLFLEIRQNSNTCNYYFVDHNLRTIFWLHAPDTISVGLLDSYSSDHLEYSLQANYWMHVELFPETASQYSAIALNDLHVTFLCARADALISETPTLPYTLNQCEDFIELLRRSKDHASSPYVVAYVARLWATIVNHRICIRFGEEHCRMSSDQSTLEVPHGKWCLVLASLSNMLLFGFPGHFEARFKSCQIVDTSRGLETVSEMVEDLKRTRSCILALLGASIPMMQMTHFTGLIKASLFLCAFDITVTSFLLLQQQQLLSPNAFISVAYLKNRNTSYGFQPTAIVHSLPQALFVWSLLLFSMQGFWMVFADLPLTLLLSTLLPVATILVVVCFGIWLTLRPRLETIEDVLSPTIPLSNPAVDQNDRPTRESVV